MKTDEIRNMTDAELEEKLRTLREDLFNLQFRLVTQRLENPLRLRLLRRDIARALTVMRERELGLARERRVASDAGASPGDAGAAPAGE